MKKLFAILISAFQLFSFSAFATSVYFPVLQMTGSTNDVTINVRAVNNPVIWNGAFHYLPANGTNFTTSGGYATNSFVPGRYTMAVVGLAQSWTIFVTNSASLLNAVDLTVGTGIVKYSGIQSLSATGLQLTNDGYGNFFLVNTNPGSANEATNVFFLDSPTITWSTTSSSNVAKLSSNVTNDWRNYTLTASNSITAAMTNQNTGTSNGLYAHIYAAVATNATTGNAATATWATNLNAPGGVSEILVSHASTDSVTSHADLGYEQTSSAATLKVGATWDLGNPAARRGEILIRDGVGDVNVSIRATNGTVYFPDRITVKEGQNYALVNGVHHPFIKTEQHSVAEPIYYWGGHALAAQAWLVGSYEEGKTNGRFSFLVGELGISWNIGRSTNAGNDVGFIAASPSTNVAAFMSGASGPELRAALSYRRDDDKNIIGGVSRGTIIAGSNALVAVGTHTLLVSSNGIVFTNLFSELSFNGVQQQAIVLPTAVYHHMTNYSTVTTNQFRSGAANGYMTNIVAGLYRIGYDVGFVGDEIGDGSYFVAIYTNDVVAAGTVGVYTVPAGAATTMMRSRVFYLPANTGISLRMKAGVADLTPAYDINLWARQQ